MGKYALYGMHLQANRHSTKSAYGQIHILWNEFTSKYIFYGMRLLVNKYFA